MCVLFWIYFFVRVTYEIIVALFPKIVYTYAIKRKEKKR